MSRGIFIVKLNTDSTLNLSSLMLILTVYYLISTIKVKVYKITSKHAAMFICYVMYVMFTVESLIVLDKN